MRRSTIDLYLDLNQVFFHHVEALIDLRLCVTLACSSLIPNSGAQGLGVAGLKVIS